MARVYSAPAILTALGLALGAGCSRPVAAPPAQAGAPVPSPSKPRDAATPPGIPATVRDSVIDRLLAVLDSAYVFPERARAFREAILARRTAGAYAGIVRGAELASALTRDLQAVAPDRHLEVMYTAGWQAFDFTTQPGLAQARAACTAWRWVCPAQVLPGNVGLIEIRAFGAVRKEIEADLASAMTTVAGTDALVIDIRRNGGGRPEAVAVVASYLFGEEPVLLHSVHWRVVARIDHFHTLRSVAGTRYGLSKPVYVLTSRRTRSAAEAFAYNLQSRKRAKVVGDTTAGAAHTGGSVRLGNDFAAWVPSGRAIDPITKTNWEGTGVVPDIAVPADSALAAALADARRRR